MKKIWLFILTYKLEFCKKNMRKYHLFIITILLLSSFVVSAQTNTFPNTGSAGIGTTDPAPSALLDLVSTSKGILVPRMTKVQRDAIISPTTGLLIFQTNLTPGFYYFDGTSWVAVSSKDAARTLNNLTTTAVNATLQPGTDNTIDLGATALSWKNLYVDGVGYLGSIKIGNYAGTPSAGFIRWTGTDFEGYNGSAWVSLTATGPGVGGAAETDLSNLSATSINTDLNPDEDKTRSLGTSVNNWNNFYMKGSIYTGNFHAFTANLNGTLFLGNNSRLEKSTLSYGNILVGSNVAEIIDNTSVGNIGIGDGVMNNSTAAVFHNVAIGFDAAQNITGSDNVFIGYLSGAFATTGDGNVAIGPNSGKTNSGIGNDMIGNAAGSNNTGNYNIFFGDGSGGFNSGSNNIFLGSYAGADNQANSNIFLGNYSGAENTTGYDNIFLGNYSGFNNTTGNFNCYIGTNEATAPGMGDYNTAMGYNVASPMGSGNTVYGALAGNTITGTNNTISGYYAADALAAGSYNVVMGANAAHNLFSGNTNVAIGNNAGYALFSGSQNVYIGGDAGRNTQLGNYNVAIGNYAGNDIVNTSNNTFVGNSAGYNVDANYNTAVGAGAASAFSMTDGTFLGYNADVSTSGLMNIIAIGKDATVSSSNTIRIGNTSVNKIGIGKAPGASSILDFQVTTARLSTGGTWVNASDERIKDQKQQLDEQEMLNKILLLNIERWHYIADEDDVFHIGPYAQQFNALFNVGDDTTISTIDPAGVALIGIQGLNTKIDSSYYLINELTKQNELLNNKINELALLVNQMQSNLMNCCNPVTQNQIITISNELPSLGQNIPNPLDNNTVIPYRIPMNCSDAYILISEISTGRIIIEEEIDCYQNQLILNTANLSAGTYGYTLKVNGSIIDTKIMIVQR